MEFDGEFAHVQWEITSSKGPFVNCYVSLPERNELQTGGKWVGLIPIHVQWINRNSPGRLAVAPLINSIRIIPWVLED